MDKTTVGVYGWIIIAVLCMGVLLTFASPFGKLTVAQVNYAVNDMIDSAFVVSEEVLLDTPELSIEGSILTIKEVERATSYKVYDGHTLLTTLTTERSIDLNDYITNPGIHVVKVIAISDTEHSKMTAIGYRL